MELILLDVDGTLVDTMRLDTVCFVQAVSDVFGIAGVDTDWAAYPDATDSAVLRHLVERANGRGLTPDQIAKVKQRFMDLLEGSMQEDPSACRPIPGGPALVRHLVASEAHAVAIATGGWEESARLKLETAGYDLSGVPIASSNDAAARTEILMLAVERVAAASGVRSFDSVTYIGDGIWDAKAASSLGYRFIGRSDLETSALVDEGAEQVVRDFSDPEALLKTITRL